MKTTKQLVTAALLTAILVAGKEAMAFLPNIEPVSLLLMLYTLVFPQLVVPVLCVYILLEGVLYGFGVWWFGYLYVWFILVGVVWLCRRNTSVILWAVINGFYGLSFGALFALSYAATGGVAAGFAWWFSGVPFDIMHCIGNVVLTLLLFKPMFSLLSTVKTKAAL